MTPSRQAALLCLAGLASVSLAFGARFQQQSPTVQAPAPIIRVTPRPPRPQAASGSSGVTAPVHHIRPVTEGAPGTSPHPATAEPAVASHPVLETEHHGPAEPKLSATGLNRNVIVLDPAHGGADSGARIGDNTLEKNVTLAFAFRLRSLLIARGFTVVLTRDSDAAIEPNTPATPLTLDDRAGIANHARAAACLSLHATGRGLGVHLYSSELDAVPAEAYLLPWLTAQAAWIPASQALEQQLGAALGRSRIALVASAASVRPVDSLTCPAVVVELAPETDTPSSVTGAGYQQRVASALASALVVWENAVQPPTKLPPPPRKIRPADDGDDTSQPETQP